MKKQSGWGDNMQNTKEELYLAAILGEYIGELPLPNTKVECYLYKLAKDGVPGGSGGGTVDLSGYATKEEVAQAVEYAHTHQNKTTLNKITAAKFESWETAVQQIGDIQTVLESIVEVSE